MVGDGKTTEVVQQCSSAAVQLSAAVEAWSLWAHKVVSSPPLLGGIGISSGLGWQRKQLVDGAVLCGFDQSRHSQAS